MNRPLLLVEDNDADAMSMLRVSNSIPLGAPIHRVKSGEDAIDYLLHRGAYSDPASSPPPLLVLLDIHLPGLNGLEVLETIRSHPEIKTTPVVMFSSSQEQSLVQAAYRDGANSYVQKPTDLSELRKAAEALSQFWLAVAQLPSVERPS
jgi:chemotaxis family two-component system response regulator Rcp1